MDELAAILNGSREVTHIDRSGPATRALLAARAHDLGKTAVIVADTAESAHELAGLAKLFLPELSASDFPVSQPLWERPLLVFPDSRHFNIRDVWASRIACLYRLYLGKASCVVSGMQSLNLRYMPRNFFDGHVLDLAVGDELSPELIIAQALEWGYERAQMVTRTGEMASRGDILDIFAAGYAKPVRLEFFGDNIEEMRLFEPDTQRSLTTVKEISLIPASPMIMDGNGIKSYLERFQKLESEGKLQENDAYSLKKKTGEDGAGILPGVAYGKNTFFEDWLPADQLWFLPSETDSATRLMASRLKLKEIIEDQESTPPQPASLALRRKSQPAPWNGKPRVYFESLRVGVEEKGISLPEKDIQSFAEIFPSQEQRDRPWHTIVKNIKDWPKHLDRIIFSFPSEKRRKKFVGLAGQDGIVPFERFDPRQKGLFALISPFHLGARLEWDRTLVLGEGIIFPRTEKQSRRPSSAFKGLDNFDSLNRGDLMVHRDYGIARFDGIHHLEINGAANDFLLLLYAGDDKLYVPVDRLGLIQKFRGQEGVAPVLDKLGGNSWANGKEKASKAIEKIAQDLVEMYALRKVTKGFHYDQPGELYREFEATFNFEETPDQARAIQEVLDDMDKPQPMDRLVCGDVGFGKTEVALRAAFRAAAEGRQVALLCPTTVLAEQHYQTFRSRLAGFPINVGLLSRFVPRAKQKETLNACAQGQIDILIGTHRILSNDVKLPNLAMLILDEEQRFGVRHKEKLKSLKQNVDVLTLTATPIPRTLQLSMSGIRDLSIIETAPVDRKPVASALIERDDETLRKVVKRELDRQGQVFWVYNRVHDLERVVDYVKKLVPDARVGMAHGQMNETELENTMRQFWHGELDVLVSTSIVESGLDFPRANTLIVDQAQMFGLGQLYQLRGRVGRSDRQAYAFFVVPDARHISELAAERLRIILDMDYLGAGFQVAMEDLRLRGAGNILGEAQSGHIARVGLDLYLEMLEEAVGKARGLPMERERDTEINLGISAHIPDTYIADGRERLRYYKSLSSAREPGEREEITLAMRDRFGQFPEELRNFLAVLEFKSFLARLQVEKADIHQNSLKLVWSKDQTAIKAERIVELVSANPEIRLLPPASLSLPLSPETSLTENLERARALIEPLSA